MSKLVKTAFAIIFSLIGLNAFLPAPIATADDAICQNDHISEEIKKASGCNANATDGLPNAISKIALNLILVLGTIALIFIIVGGIQYMTSAGDAGKIKKAKDTILYAVIGLVICVLSFAIVNFVILGLE